MSDILKDVAQVLDAEHISDEDPDEDGVLMGQDFVTYRQLENDCMVLGSHYGGCPAKFLIEQAGRVCTWQPDEDFSDNTGQPKPATM